MASLLTLGLLIWGLDKGFDFTDEGYYLLGLQSNQERFSAENAFHLLTITRLLGWINGGVLFYRWLSLAFSTIAALVFAAGVREYLFRSGITRRSLAFAPILLATWLGNVSWSSALPLTCSYNILINALLVTFAGLFLWILANSNAESRRGWAYPAGWVSLGALWGLAATIKPTASAVCLILTACVYLVSERFLAAFYTAQENSRKLVTLFLPAVYFGLGVGLCLFLYLCGLNTLPEWINALSVRQSLPGYSLSAFSYRLFRDLADFTRLILVMTGPLGYGWILAKLYLSIVQPTKTQRIVFAFLTTWIIIYTPWMLHQQRGFLNVFPFDTHPMNTTPLIALGLGFGLVLLLAARRTPLDRQMLTIVRNDQSRQEITVGLFLFSLPLAIAFGTNNPLLWQAGLSLAPWVGLGCFLMIRLTHSPRLATLAWIAAALVIAWYTAQWAYGYLFYPYRLATNRFQQTESLGSAFSRAAGVRVDPATRDFLVSLNQAIQTTPFQPGDPILGFYDTPGLVYLLGGISPGTPWFTSQTGATAWSCASLKKSGVNFSRAILLLSTQLPGDLLACLQAVGVDYPARYTKIAEIPRPTDMTMLNLYSPQP